MRILLTGATGFLGNNLARALLHEGHLLTVTKRASSDLRPLDGLEVELLDVDLNDSTVVQDAVSRQEVVIHCAAMIQLGWTRLEQSRRVNVEGTRTIAEVCRRQGVRMIHVSTVDALAASDGKTLVNESQREPAKPACSYVVSKREAEEAFLAEVQKGLDGLIVQPGFMVGPFDWKPSSGEMMLAIYRQWVPFAPAGGCSVADVRDVAAGIVSAIQHGRTGERYILGGENVTYLDLWQRMARIMDRPRPKLMLPNWIAATAGRAGDFVGRIKGEEPQVNSAATRMGQIFHWYDSEKARRELGYQTQSVDTAIEDAWKWFKAYEYVT